MTDSSTDEFTKISNGILESLSESLSHSRRGITSTAQERTQPASHPHAVQMSLWEESKGRFITERSSHIRETLGLPGEPPEVRDAELDAAFTEAYTRTADFYSSAYLNHVYLHEHVDNKDAKAYMAMLTESDDFRDLRASTVLDPTLSELACLNLSSGYRQYVDDLEEARKNGQDESEVAVGAKDHIHNACTQAAEDIASYGDICEALGAGTESGHNNRMPADELRALLEAYKKSDYLRDVCERAGRFQSVASAQQKRKTRDGMEDVRGAEMGGQLSRMLPHELSKLAHPLLKWDVLKRYSEGQVMIRDHFGEEPVAKGPILMFVDESGSVQGDKLKNSKAMALAMYWIARHQGRWCCLSGFASKGQLYTQVFHKTSANPDGLVDFIHHNYSGGTSFDFLHSDNLETIVSKTTAPAASADIIVLTDGRGSGKTWQASFRSWRAAHKTRLIVLAVGTSGGDFEGVADEIHQMSQLTENADGVKSAFSI